MEQYMHCLNDLRCEFERQHVQLKNAVCQNESYARRVAELSNCTAKQSCSERKSNRQLTYLILGLLVFLILLVLFAPRIHDWLGLVNERIVSISKDIKSCPWFPFSTDN